MHNPDCQCCLLTRKYLSEANRTKDLFLSIPGYPSLSGAEMDQIFGQAMHQALHDMETVYERELYAANARADYIMQTATRLAEELRELRPAPIQDINAA